jgi:hypothetical protein
VLLAKLNKSIQGLAYLPSPVNVVSDKDESTAFEALQHGCELIGSAMYIANDREVLTHPYSLR